MPCQQPFRGDSAQLLLYKIASCIADGGFVAGVSSFNGQTGPVVLSSGDVTDALGFTPISESDGDSRYVLKTGDSMSGLLTIDTAVTSLRAITTDAGTANSPLTVEIYHRTSGVPVAGFGNRLQWYADTDTGSDQIQARIDAQWEDATDATRRSRLVFGTRLTGGVISSPLILSGGQTQVQAGLVTVPGLTFQNDLDTGLYQSGVSNLRIAVDGNLVANFVVSGLSLTGGTVTTSLPVLSLAQTWNNAATSFNGFLYNITNTAAAAGSFLFQFQIDSSDRFSLSENGQLTATRQGLTNSAMSFITRKRGSSISATGVVTNNGAIGNWVFQGWQGAGFTTGGSIATVVEGDWSGSNSGMSIQFQVTPTGVFNNPVNILNLNGGVGGLTFQRSVKYPYVAKIADYTITEADYTINCTSGTFTVTLPTAIGIVGRVHVIKNSGVGSITLDANGTQTIDTLATQPIVSGGAMMVQSDGANWIII